MDNAPRSAESVFFDIFLDGEKLASSIQPSTQLLLGVKERDMMSLSSLEGEAGAVQEQDEVSDDDVLSARADEAAASEELAFVARPGKPFDPTKYSSLFASDRTHPILMAELLRSMYKEAWVEWEPETLWWAIRKDFGSVGEVSRNKIMAMRVALTTDIPWNDWDVFEDSGTAWNDHVPIFGAFQPLPPTEAAFTVHVLKVLRPEFSINSEVTAYLGSIIEDSGFVFVPNAWFPGVQKLLDRKTWVHALKVDVKSAWSTVRKMGSDEILDVDFDSKDPRDIHIGKLIAIKEYLSARAAGKVTQRRNGVAYAKRQPVVTS